MPPTRAIPESSLLRVLLERVLRTECLALEGVRLQAIVHHGLLGGEVDELVKGAEQRAYHRAEMLLTQLLAATADISTTPSGLPSSSL